MISRSIALAAAMAVNLGASAPALAHHSYAGYDRHHLVTIEGDILEINWSNPHVSMMISQAGAEPYRIEWNNVHRMKKAGVDKDMLKAGDHVLITGAVNKNPKKRIMTLLDKVFRPADGWTWSRPGKGNGSVSQQASTQ